VTIPYSRDYDRILDDLSDALNTIPRYYETFEMNSEQWAELNDDEKAVCLRTLADDVFYVLGSESIAEVGSGSAEYDESRAMIKINAGPQLVHLVSLRE
jgi:hypothetical protein